MGNEEELARLRAENADLERKLGQQQETTARWVRVVTELKLINKRQAVEIEQLKALQKTEAGNLW